MPYSVYSLLIMQSKDEDAQHCYICSSAPSPLCMDGIDFEHSHHLRYRQSQKNKHNAELKWTDPGTKVKSEFSIRGLFSHLMLEMDRYFIISVRKKYTQMIGHMRWLYQ